MFTADDVLDARQVAELLRVRPKTVHDWSRTGRIPCRKRGKSWFYLRDELERWLRAPDDDDRSNT